MAKINQVDIKINNGQRGSIRSPLLEDARAITSLSKEVIGEEIYHITTLEEFKMSEEQCQEWIIHHNLDPNKLLLVAEVAGKVVGFLDFANGHRLRLEHQGSLGISIQKNYRGLGLGKLLMETLIHWAQDHPIIEKICLEVLASNEPAIQLYKSLGFNIEGRKIKQLKLDDHTYEDLIQMAKLLN